MAILEVFDVPLVHADLELGGGDSAEQNGQTGVPFWHTQID